MKRRVERLKIARRFKNTSGDSLAVGGVSRFVKKKKELGLIAVAAFQIGHFLLSTAAAFTKSILSHAAYTHSFIVARP